MEGLVGYARVLAQARINKYQQKTFFGKPHLKYMQCLAFWSYFFQLGGILGAKYSGKLDVFGPSFLGVKGASGAVENFFTELSRDIMDHCLSDSTTFLDYVLIDQKKRFSFSGDTVSFLQKIGKEKIKPETFAEAARQYAECGASLGAIYPKEIRKMFERTHSLAPNQDWGKAVELGLDIPHEQVITNYSDVEKDEIELFMVYCSECCPDYHVILNT